VKYSFLLGVALALSLPVEAAILNVPVDQPTIQAAINAAKKGDTILVAPGIYRENINFLGKAIVVKSSGGSKVTIIDGGRLGPVVTFNTNEGRKSILSGFTIQNGDGNYNAGYDGGGVRIFYASPTVTANIITHNTAANGGAGIAVEFSSALVQGNTVTYNSQAPGFSGGVGGGGIFVGGAGAAQIVGNNIQNNSWMTSDGGGMTLFAAGTPTLRNNIIKWNTAGSQGGGIWIVNYSDALILQNLITNNTAPQGAGIYFLVPSGYRGPLLVNNTIAGTSSSPQGSAVYAAGFYDQVVFYNNVLVGAAGTSAMYCDNTYDQTPPTLSHNDGFSLTGTGFGGACNPQNGVNGNIAADPMFVGPTNFRLKVGSPGIDAGLNTAPNLPPKDLAGAQRIVDALNDGSGPVIDLGVYEYPN